MAESQATSIQRQIKDLVAGTVGGTVQVLLGQPFDIVKVRLQSNPGLYPSAITAAKSIWRDEGPLAFYKGTLVPLIGIGGCVAVQFWLFHDMRRRLLRQNQKTDPTASKLSFPQYYLAGAYAGVGNSVLSGPIEHIRIKLQTQPSGAKKLYNGPGDCIRKIYSIDGIKGIYRAQVPTILREGQAYGLWFLTYEYLVQRSVAATGGKRDDLAAWKLCGFGAIAGLAFWVGSYPLDVIKSRMQSDVGFNNKIPGEMTQFREKFGEIGSTRRYTGMLDCSRKVFAESGLGGFWKGLAPTLVRAIPCSAGTFAAYYLEMVLLTTVLSLRCDCWARYWKRRT